MWSEKKYFSDAGIKTFYLTMGQGDPVVFFHGVGASPYTYTPILEPIAKHFLVICPQIPPFGQSGIPPAAWTFVDYGAYFSTFLKTLGFSQVYLAGHSFGGAIAAYTSVSPLVKKLLLLSPTLAPRNESLLYMIRSVVGGSIVGCLLGKETIRVDLLNHFFANMFSHPLSFFSLMQLLNHCFSAPTFSALHISVPTEVVWAASEEILPLTDINQIKKQCDKIFVISHPGYHNWCFFDLPAVGEYAQEFFG